MKLVNEVTHILKRNAPVILSSTAITGVVTTAYLSAKASIRAHDRISAYRHTHDNPDMSRQEKLKKQIPLCWKLYIPAVASGAVTIGCIVGTTRVTNKRAAAAQAAFVLSERAYAEYRNKVIEDLGERKDQGIRDSIAEDKVRNNPPPANLIIGGAGSVLCCELQTGRYFSSDMESLRRAENEINARLVRQDSATLDDLYYLIGLSSTSNSGDMGWNSDKLLTFEFTSVLDDQGRPCLAFEYNYIRPLFEGMFR